MFTGIIAAVGRVTESTPSAAGMKLRVDPGGLPLDDVQVGDSIAVNGVCLTVVSLYRDAFEVDVSHETLSCATGFEHGAARRWDMPILALDWAALYRHPP